MKEEKQYLVLDPEESSIIIDSLNDKRTSLINKGKTSDAVDDLILKVGFAPKKKFKVIRDEHESR